MTYALAQDRLSPYHFIFIYSPNAIKTKQNKITQLGMTTRQRICTYRSHCVQLWCILLELQVATLQRIIICSMHM